MRTDFLKVNRSDLMMDCRLGYPKDWMMVKNSKSRLRMMTENYWENLRENPRASR
jgi:hypothetical protein